MTALIAEADERALILWDRYNEQKGDCERLESGPATRAQCQASYDALFAIEKLLQADIAVSLQALAGVLMIEIGDEDREDVPGLWRASLAAIRPQLVGAIAEGHRQHSPAPVTPSRGLSNTTSQTFQRRAASTCGHWPDRRSLRPERNCHRRSARAAFGLPFFCVGALYAHRRGKSARRRSGQMLDRLVAIRTRVPPTGREPPQPDFGDQSKVTERCGISKPIRGARPKYEYTGHNVPRPLLPFRIVADSRRN
jgi:hypothetical protein